MRKHFCLNTSGRADMAISLHQLPAVCVDGNQKADEERSVDETFKLLFVSLLVSPLLIWCYNLVLHLPKRKCKVFCFSCIKYSATDMQELYREALQFLLWRTWNLQCVLLIAESSMTNVPTSFERSWGVTEGFMFHTPLGIALQVSVSFSLFVLSVMFHHVTGNKMEVIKNSTMELWLHCTTSIVIREPHGKQKGQPLNTSFRLANESRRLC